MDCMRLAQKKSCHKTVAEMCGTRSRSSGVILKGQTARLSAAEPGTYNYICGLHPQMKGKIEVR